MTDTVAHEPLVADTLVADPLVADTVVADTVAHEPLVAPSLAPDPTPVPLALGAEETAKVVNRLRRAQGQLNAVILMLEEGRDCQAVVTQLSAVSKAVDRAGFTLISSTLEQCLTASGGKDTVNVAKLQKLFLSLA